jgi:hypothetical protein
MDKQTFEALVTQHSGKPSLDATLRTSAVRQAVQFIERNWTLQYMKRFVTFSFDTASTEPRALTPPSRPKSIKFVRIIKADGTFHYIKRVNPRDVIGVEVKIPDGFWLDAFDFIWFDNTPDQDYSAEMLYIQKTDWDGVQDNGTHWLIDNAEDTLLARAILQLAPSIREPKLIAWYDKLWQEGIRTLLLEDDETNYDGTDESMTYVGG